MTRVGACNSKPADQCGLISRDLGTCRFRNRTIQSTATHLEILSRPRIRKSDRETNAVRLSICTRALVDDSVNSAMRWKHRTIAAARTGSAARRHCGSACNFKRRPWTLEPRYVCALRIRLSKRGDLERHREKGYDQELHRFSPCEAESNTDFPRSQRPTCRVSLKLEELIIFLARSLKV